MYDAIGIGLMRTKLALCIALSLTAMSASAATLDAVAINKAQWDKKSNSAPEALLIKAQVLLSRAHFSPGEIDGKPGENLKKAIVAFAPDIKSNGELNEEVWRSLSEVSAESIITDYKLTDEDVDGPFAKKIPAKMVEMKDLPALSYTGVREKLAEKFHMSQALLGALNPGAKFDAAGDTIKVVNIDTGPLSKAARLEIDKTAQTLKAFDRDERLIAFFPVTAGSTEKPAPSGRLKVTGINQNPTYRYNPDYAFKGVRSREPFTIRPGPNNPVGVVWIGLSQKGYGIHGTPDPSKVSKTESNGCIRLTNWDALKLATAVTKGTPVDFKGVEAARDTRAQGKLERRRR